MTHKGIILAVDDTPASLKLLTELLKADGYEVHSAINGDLALQSAISNPPDLVLLDVRMDGMDGFEVCRRLKAQDSTRGIPVIFVSALSAPDEKVQGFELGAVDFVTKPYQRDELLARVRTHLELVNLRQHLEDLVDARTRELLEREASLRKLNRALKALSEGNRALVHAREEQELMHNICRAATDSGGYALAWVGHVHHDTDKRIEPVAFSGRDQRYIDNLKVTWADEPRGRGPSGQAVRTGQTQAIQDIANDPRMEPWRDAALEYGFASCLALPLQQNGSVLGVLNIYAAESDAFGSDEIRLLEEMAGDLAFGIATLRTRAERDHAVAESQRYSNELREGLEDAVDAIATTLEMRDPYTAGHQRRVADLAKAIAKELGMCDEECHGIYLAAIVHDIGKINVPAEILSKPGRLNDIEYLMVKQHVTGSHEILKGIKFPWPIAEMVYQHHERMNGTGYPRGLKEADILPGGRILAVADVVEAMHSHRPYRPGFGIDTALQEIEKGRGTLYDATVADACLKLFREGKFQY